MRLLIIFVMLLLSSSPALADRRVALVIGNSAYEHVPQLANPKNDAADMAAKLESLGFEVVRGSDLDLSDMRKAARDFTNKLEGAQLSLFFYAGHGLQVNGNNYMAPVDAKLASYDDLDYEVLSMDLILSAMERKTKVNLVFLDACRDNPMAENLARSMGTRSTAVGRGLAKLGSGVGSLIAFATQPGNVALDGKGRNSPFTSALLNHLGTPGQSVTDDLINVRKEVLDATEGKQVPWDNSSLTGPVVLKEKPKEEVKLEIIPAAKAPDLAKPASEVNSQLELAYWEAIKDATDKGFFEAYLQQYPKGTFASLAYLRINQIDKHAAGEKQAVEAQQAEQKRLGKEAAAKAVEEDAAREKARLAEAGDAEKQKAFETAKLEQPAPTESITDMAPIDPAELAIATQKELARIGCLSGKADGKWGSGSERALKDYAGRQGVKLASLQPDANTLVRLRATNVRVCPLICGKGMEEKNGRCEKIKREASINPKSISDKTKGLPIENNKKKLVSSYSCRICKPTVGTNFGQPVRVCRDPLGWARDASYYRCN